MFHDDVLCEAVEIVLELFLAHDFLCGWLRCRLRHLILGKVA